MNSAIPRSLPVLIGHGTLVQLREQGPLRFRCHTGHAFTAGSLVAALSETTEDTLWSALRVLQENVMLTRHMAAHARESHGDHEAAKLLRETRSIGQRAQLVRKALLGDDTISDQAAVNRRGTT